MYRQIQSWPTPEFFIIRGLGVRTVFDRLESDIVLVRVVVPNPVSRALNESASCQVTLTTCVIPAFVLRSLNDRLASILVLSSIVVPSGISRTLTPESIAQTLILYSALVPLPVNDSITDTADCGYGLNSVALF